MMRTQFARRLIEWIVGRVGWPILILNGDPLVFDRWLFVRGALREGACRTLDAGSGNGGFSFYAASRGNRTVGLTFRADEVERARHRAQVLGLADTQFECVDLRELAMDEIARDGQFDQVICLEVVEHLLDDQLLLNTLSGLLRPGGQLILSTPALEHPPLRFERLSSCEDGGHVRWGYAAADLVRQVEHAGLRAVYVGHRSGVVSQWITNLGRLLGARFGGSVGWAMTLPLRPLIVFDRPLTRLTGHPWHCLNLVAMRPETSV